MSTTDVDGLSNREPVFAKQRAVPRVVPKQPLDATVMAMQPARIVDISSHGAQIEVAGSLQPSGPCDLRIRFADGEFAVHATVRRCRAWGFGQDDEGERIVLYRAGVEFDEVDSESLALLSSHVLSPPGT